MKRPLLAFVIGIAVAASVHAQMPAASDESPRADERLPKLELTGQVLYQFLLAEIAAQRGQFDIAAAAFLDLAKTTRDPRIVRRATEIAFHARQYDSALEAARLWIELDPEAPAARQTLATLLLASGRIDELAERLGRELAADPQKAGDALMRMLRAFARYPDRIAVQRVFDQVTQPFLGLPEARFVRAQAAIGAGKGEAARREIDLALELKPAWERAALFKAELLPRGAPQLDYLEGWLAAHPDAQDVRLGYARALVGEKRYEPARAEFRRLLGNNPDNPDMLYAVGILSLQANDTAEAERHLRRFVEFGRGEVNTARFYLGQIAEQAGRPEEAINWYDQVGAGEHVTPARVRAAQILFRQNKPEEGRERLAAARSLAPDDARLLIAEAQLLRDAGRHADSYALLAAALQAQPDEPDLLYESALSAERLGRMDVLEGNLRRLMEIRPNSAPAYNALGFSLADRNVRLEEAAQLIERALALAPDDPFILDSKGWLLFRQGRYADALAALQRAFGKRPDPEIAAHIGEVLWALGRPAEAKAVWAQAAKAHPNNEVLAATIKRFTP